MASENPPTAPAAKAHRILVRDGKTPCCANAMANISTKAQMCENAVSTKALARREPYPPAKSAAPQRNTAVTEQTAGANWVREGTPDEGNMLANKGDKRQAQCESDRLENASWDRLLNSTEDRYEACIDCLGVPCIQCFRPGADLG